MSIPKEQAADRVLAVMRTRLGRRIVVLALKVLLSGALIAYVATRVDLGLLLVSWVAASAGMTSNLWQRESELTLVGMTPPLSAR